MEPFARLRPHTIFAPPSKEGTIIFPGFDGGAEWGGGRAGILWRLGGGDGRAAECDAALEDALLEVRQLLDGHLGAEIAAGDHDGKGLSARRLHDDQADQQQQGCAAGEAAWPDGHALSTVVEST